MKTQEVRYSLFYSHHCLPLRGSNPVQFADLEEREIPHRGHEREERKAEAPRYGFGGVRTFPLIGLIGYSLALLSGSQTIPIALGFFALAGFLCVSY